MDYAKYGLDLPEGADVAAGRDTAFRASLEALNAELAVRESDDDEDRAILQKRADAAKRVADDARRAAELTKTEITRFQAAQLRTHLQQQANAHLQHEIERQRAASAGRPTKEYERALTDLERRVEIIEDLIDELDASPVPPVTGA